MNEKDRIQWIDALKGIGIIIVILGHACPDYWMARSITSFHMPLFFMISGYLFHAERYPRFGGFLVSRAKSLLVPFLAFSAISMAASAFRNVLEPGTTDLRLLVVTFLRTGEVESNLPLWFLRELLVIELVFYLAKRLLRPQRLCAAVMICLSVCVTLLAEDPYLRRYANGMIFIVLGNLLAEAEKSGVFTRLAERWRDSAGALLMWPFLLVVWQSVVYRREDLDITAREGMPLLVVTALIGGGFCLMLAGYLQSSRLLRYLGKNSLPIMATHILVMDVLVIVLTKAGIPRDLLKECTVLNNLRLTGCILLAELPLLALIDRFLPFLAGRWYPAAGRRADGPARAKD